MTLRTLVWVSLLAWCLSPVGTAEATAGRKLSFPLRGHTLSLTIYRPTAAPRGTIIMGSGDVGWVGLAVKMSEFLSDEGFAVVGVNAREYLSAFTDGPRHVSPADVGADYAELARMLDKEGLLPHPVLLSGVSEGAGLAILAGGHAPNHAWLDGVVAMGLPATAELAWRWTDVAALVRKKDPDEPSFAPEAFVGRIAPLPLAMIQSSTDEYISDAGRERLRTAAGQPSTMQIIPAANHRFTDKVPEVKAALLNAVVWAISHAPRR